MAPTAQPGRIEHLDPADLPRNPAFTPVISVSGSVTTVYVGGQDAVDASGTVVGKGDIGAQAEQIFRNLRMALGAAEAGLEHVIKWTVYVVHGQPAQPAFEVFQHEWGNRPNPPTITLVYVAALAHPDFLMEIDAVAVVPERR